MFVEKVQSSTPGILGGLGVIALWIGIVVKSVLRAGIDLVLERFAVLLHGFLQRRHPGGDPLVFLAVAGQDRSGNIFYVVEVVGVAAVINHPRRQVSVPSQNQRRLSSAPAKSDHADFVGSNIILAF